MTSWEDKIELGEDCVERLLVPEKLPALDTYDIVTGGVIDTRGHYLVSREDAKVHVLLFSVEGQGLLKTCDGTYLIPAQSFVIIPSGTSFEFSLNSRHWQLAWLLLDPAGKWQLSKTQSAQIHATQNTINVFHLMSFLYYESLHSSHINSLSSNTQLLNDILEKTLSLPLNADRDSSLNNVFTLIQEQLHLPWKVEHIAELACVSSSHLFRLCRYTYGMSPAQKVTEMKMLRAQHFLSYSDWSITEIATRVGYADAFNFSHAFKRFSGISPTAYRLPRRT